MRTEIYTSLLEKLASVNKKAFVPGDQVGQTQVDPMTGMPIDPMTGMPIDPMTGMPIDPAMMEQMMAGGGGMPPGAMPPDPSMGGMPPDPSMGGMPPDPSMGGMPPEGPAPGGGGAETGTGAPATVDDLAILEERVSGLEDVIEDLVATIEALGGKKLSDAKVEATSGGSSSEQAPAAPAVPGPFGSNAGEALASVNPSATGTTLNNLMGRLSELKAV